MPTRVTQIDDDASRRTTLQIEGEMFGEDACLIERISMKIRAETGNNITIDLADLNFLDSDAAPILKRLESPDGFDIGGIEIFLQSVVNEVERHGATTCT